MKASPLTESLAQSVIAGDERAIARAATLIEADTVSGRQLLQTLFRRTGKAMIVGITGPPGAGKSTLVSRLVTECRLQRLTVGVIAVDPSSSYSRGALLGDRIRMQQHYQDKGVFIRSMATRGRLGGLAQATLNLALILDAAGLNVIFIETVGVGQDEIDIAGMADVTVVTLVPGMGDDVQAVKAGIIEIADVFAINKSDLAGADDLVHAIHFMQTLGEKSAPGHGAPLCKVSAKEGTGMQCLLAEIQSSFAAKGKQDSLAKVWEHRLSEQLRETILNELPSEVLAHHASRVAERAEDPYSAVISLRAELLASRH